MYGGTVSLANGLPSTAERHGNDVPVGGGARQERRARADGRRPRVGERGRRPFRAVGGHGERRKHDREGREQCEQRPARASTRSLGVRFSTHRARPQEGDPLPRLARHSDRRPRAGSAATGRPAPRMAQERPRIAEVVVLEDVPRTRRREELGEARGDALVQRRPLQLAGRRGGSGAGGPAGQAAAAGRRRRGGRSARRRLVRAAPRTTSRPTDARSPRSASSSRRSRRRTRRSRCPRSPPQRRRAPAPRSPRPRCRSSRERSRA